jgi:hypothetical protein
MKNLSRAGLASILGTIFLSACVPATQPEAGIAPPPIASSYGKPQPLLGWDAKRLTSRFGEPRLDIRDKTVRKLQFVTGGCVLDTYLYATARGKEPVVTHIDTRRSDGRDVDPAVCQIR